MAKKIVKLKSKREVEIRDMSIDEIDFCNDVAILRSDDNGDAYVTGLAKSRTAWLRKGINGGTFDKFTKDPTGDISDSVIKQLNDTEKNELVVAIQKYQEVGE